MERHEDNRRRQRCWGLEGPIDGHGHQALAGLKHFLGLAEHVEDHALGTTQGVAQDVERGQRHAAAVGGKAHGAYLTPHWENGAGPVVHFPRRRGQPLETIQHLGRTPAADVRGHGGHSDQVEKGREPGESRESAHRAGQVGAQKVARRVGDEGVILVRPHPLLLLVLVACFFWDPVAGPGKELVVELLEHGDRHRVSAQVGHRIRLELEDEIDPGPAGASRVGHRIVRGHTGVPGWPEPNTENDRHPVRPLKGEGGDQPVEAGLVPGFRFRALEPDGGSTPAVDPPGELLIGGHVRPGFLGHLESPPQSRSPVQKRPYASSLRSLLTLPARIICFSASVISMASIAPMVCE